MLEGTCNSIIVHDATSLGRGWIVVRSGEGYFTFNRYQGVGWAWLEIGQTGMNSFGFGEESSNPFHCREKYW